VTNLMKTDYGAGSPCGISLIKIDSQVNRRWKRGKIAWTLEMPRAADDG